MCSFFYLFVLLSCFTVTFILVYGMSVTLLFACYFQTNTEISPMNCVAAVSHGLLSDVLQCHLSAVVLGTWLSEPRSRCHTG